MGDPLFDDDNYPQPFIDLIYENATDIFKTDNDKSIIEFVFNCAFSIIFEQPSFLNANLEKLCVILSQQSDEFNKLNIKLLCLLFNLTPPQNALRCSIMQRLLDLGKQMKAPLAQQLFRGQLGCIEQWIDNEWSTHLDVGQKKRLYQSASAVAYKAAERKIYLKFLLKYLKLFDIADAIDKVVVDEAAQAVIAAISSSEFNTENVNELIRCPIICNAMSGTPKYKQLYALLSIVYRGNVDEFETFYRANTSAFSQLGLDYANLRRKMRLLTLCSLGNVVGRDEHSYSFEELMATLQLTTQNELEELVICAITEKLLFAKIDYATGQVDITRAKQRTFDMNAWQTVADKLSLWRQNTNTVLQIIHNAGLNKWRQQYMQQMAKKAANK